MNVARLVASTRVMLAGCVWLAAALACAPHLDSASWLVVSAPLALLSGNLAAAIATCAALRRGGLALFHVALLALMIVAGVGRLLHLDARVEVTEGGAFDPAAVDVQSRGPLHPDRFAAIRFAQGRYTTDYAPNVKRAQTHSEVAVDDGGEGPARMQTVGDDTPLVIDGYRFYTTHNKGFAPVVTWTADGAAPITGALHMPSYPLFDYNQQIDWSPPAAKPLRVWLVVAPIVDSAAWRLDPSRTSSQLVVHAGDDRRELAPGDSMRTGAGVLRYERLAGWMGYRIFYDPTLPWLFGLAAAAACGLAWHLGEQLVRTRPARSIRALQGPR